jgi:hypothetical protein
MIPQQAALFKVQLWHLREAEGLQGEIESHPAYYRRFPKEKASLRRQAKRHRKFSDAITPFLMPLCLCALSYLFASILLSKAFSP